MSSFWTLVGFEYKKILKKKSVIIALSIGFLASVISVVAVLFGNNYIDGKPFETNYEGMVKDRNYDRSMNGAEINGSLIMEAAAAYGTIPDNSQNYRATKKYQSNARPYSAIYNIVGQVYETSGKDFNIETFSSMTEEEAGQFNAKRKDKLEAAVNNTLMSETAKKTVLRRAGRIKEPLVFSFRDGYTRFLAIIYTSGILAAFVMAVCTAPIFAGEYSMGTDQLILSSKHGKGKLIGAKLFTGFTLAGLISLVICLQTYLQCMLVFGFDGGGAPIQIYVPLCPYPLTLGQAVLLQSISVIFACLLTAAVVILLSAKFKSPFGVIIIASLFLFLPMMVSVSSKPLLPYQLYNLLPSNMMSDDMGVLNIIQYELFGIVIPPFLMYPAAAAVLSAVITPFSYKAFQKHQIG